MNSTARSHANSHRVTYWHASARLSTPLGDGWSREEHYRCTHNHATPEAAEECGHRLEVALMRGTVPAWTRILH